MHAQQQGKGRAGDKNQDIARNKHSSTSVIAKGGWQQPPQSRRELQLGKEVKPSHRVGYQFDFWNTAAAKKEKAWPSHRRDRQPPGVDVATTRDCDAMLELHYGPETNVERLGAELAATQVSWGEKLQQTSDKWTRYKLSQPNILSIKWWFSSNISAVQYVACIFSPSPLRYI